MFRKNALKIFIFSLCALLIAPIFSFKNIVANASEADVIAPRSVDFVYDIKNEAFNEVDASEITVKVSGVEVYKNGAMVTLDDADAMKGVVATLTYAKGSTDVSSEIKSKFTKVGEYTVTVSTTGLEESFTLKISNNASDFEGKLSYKTNDSTALTKYADSVTEKANGLKVGSNYTAPSFEPILNFANLDYSALTKTIYYAVSGATSYSTTTSSFDITTAGTYRFYATFSTDELFIGNEESALSISTKNLLEKLDGFYKVTLVSSGKQVYVSNHGGNLEYFEDEELENELEVTEADLNYERIIPIFTFEITETEPYVSANSSYQENGYIDYEYKNVSFDIKGSDLTVEYVLEYCENEKDINVESAWQVYNEVELSSSLTFTPNKKGYYRVKAIVYSNDSTPKTATTKAIKVSEKFTTVEFKASFEDWLSVNTAPFIFLCISAAALIGLIIVLFIPVKDKKEEKVVKAEESDK